MTTTSADNLQIVGYIIGALVTISGGFLIWEVLHYPNMTFSANWNMFKSPLGSVCIFIGFFMAMIWWGKFTHWSATPVVETRDSWGNIKRTEDYDMSNQMFGKFILPLLGHFVIEPLIYGAIIYYPLQCVIAVVGSIFPYVLSLIILIVIIAVWLWGNNTNRNTIVFAIAGVLLVIGFSVGAYFLHSKSDSSYNNTSNIEKTATSVTDEESVDEKNFEDADIDESEFE